jgi:hypothetical protein
MSFPRRTLVLHILPVVLVVCITRYAGAQAPTALPSAAPSAGVAQPAVPMSVAPVARPTVATPEASLHVLLSDLAAGEGSLTDAVLVIPGKPTDPQVVGQIVEDLSVMSRIIAKNVLGEYHETRAFGGSADFAWTSNPGRAGLGPDVLFASLGQPKPMYLGGYGAVFFIQVNYPLLPPPQTPQEQPAAQQEDAVWAQAKRDVLEPRANVVLPQEVGEPAEPYNRERVDSLRGQLIATMKHATNIRALEPTEWITVVVQGPGPAAPQARQSSPSGLMANPAPAEPADRTVMTLRATKADVDQYAKGQLNQQQFEQRLQIITY